jgi:hypothetical protein
MTATGILQNKHCLYISTNLLDFPENMGPRIISKYDLNWFEEEELLLVDIVVVVVTKNDISYLYIFIVQIYCKTKQNK